MGKSFAFHSSMVPFEIYSATITNSTFDVAMTIPQEKKFTAAIMEDVGSYFDMLAMIDLRQSEASFENDKLQIFFWNSHLYSS